jgi:tetratricopeptide (TPR) repeat protein
VRGEPPYIEGQRILSIRQKVLVSIYCLATFLAVSYIFLMFVERFGIGWDSDIPVILSLVAGAFASLIVLLANGIIGEFSVKGGIFEFTTRLSEKIESVKTDVADTRRDVGEKLSALSNNLQFINNRLDNVMTSINLSSNTANQNQINRLDQKQINYNDLPGVFTVVLSAIKEARSEGMSMRGITTKLDPTKELNLPSGEQTFFEKSFEIQNKMEEIIAKSNVEAIEKIPSPVEISRQIQDANYMFYTGQYVRASEIYQRVLDLDPNNVDALLNNGIVLYRLGKHRDARSFFERTLEIDGGNADALTYMCFTLNRLGRREEAQLYYEKVSKIKINESNIDALVNKGIALETVGKPDESLYYYHKAADMIVNESNIDALVNKGIALDRIGLHERRPERHQEAMECFDKALLLNPENTFALYSKASSFSLQENDEEALKLLEYVVRLCSGFKDLAKNDIDFKRLKNNERFKKLVS